MPTLSHVVFGLLLAGVGALLYLALLGWICGRERGS